MSLDHQTFSGAFGAAVEHARGDAALKEAVRAAADLIALWPLTKAQHMENDEKYAENLQVRLTRQFVLLAGHEATMPDAEYVYEGAQTIPGRDQSIVDALLDANDAYDESQAFSEDLDPDHLGEAFRVESLGLDVTSPAAQRFVGVVDSLLALFDVDGTGETAAQAMADKAARLDLDQRVAFCVLAFAALLAAGDDDLIAIPALLATNEFAEILGVPRAAVSTDDVPGLRAAAATALDGNPDAFVALIAPMIDKEWKRHHDDVLWDPDEAARIAKEEDEKRNKAALAAKFAHVKDDPGKEKVEL